MAALHAATELPGGRVVRLLRPLVAAFVMAVLAAMAGCSTLGYYTQAVGGHLSLMHAARPVAERLADPATPEPLRARLVQARAIRDFAVTALALPDNGSYRSYADVGRPYVLWNVFVTPAFSTRPVRSCFPVAGCVDYRGWYDRDEAERAAADYRARGLDVFVGGVPAYSTLGWFDDPLLNTFIAYPEAEVARLLFHELAHQVVYVRDDSVFNESFAVAVEDAGMERWHAQRNDTQERLRYEQARERRRQFVTLMLRHRAILEAFYDRQLPDEQRKEGKARLFAALQGDYAALRESWGGYPGFDRYFDQGANNALLASIATYSVKVPAFRALLAQQGGDFPAFYREVRRLAALPVAERDAALARLAPQTAPEISLLAR